MHACRCTGFRPQGSARTRKYSRRARHCREHCTKSGRLISRRCVSGSRTWYRLRVERQAGQPVRCSSQSKVQSLLKLCPGAAYAHAAHRWALLVVPRPQGDTAGAASPAVDVFRVVVLDEPVAPRVRAQHAQLGAAAHVARLPGMAKDRWHGVGRRRQATAGAALYASTPSHPDRASAAQVRSQTTEVCRATCLRVHSPAAQNSTRPPGLPPAASPAAAPAGAPTACSELRRWSAGCPVASSRASRRPGPRGSGGGGRPRARRAARPCSKGRDRDQVSPRGG